MKRQRTLEDDAEVLFLLGSDGIDEKLHPNGIDEAVVARYASLTDRQVRASLRRLLAARKIKQFEIDGHPCYKRSKLAAIRRWARHHRHGRRKEIDRSQFGRADCSKVRKARKWKEAV